MNNYVQMGISMIPIFCLGALLGAFYFGILWSSVRWGMNSNNPIKWFLIGLVIRMSVALTCFYFVSKSGWLPLLICLFGFVATRKLALNEVSSLPATKQTLVKNEKTNAP